VSSPKVGKADENFFLAKSNTSNIHRIASVLSPSPEHTYLIVTQPHFPKKCSTKPSSYTDMTPTLMLKYFLDYFVS